MQHPCLGQQPPDQGGEQGQNQEDTHIHPGMEGHLGQAAPQFRRDATADPAHCQQRQHGPQLGGHQHAPQPLLQARHGPGAGLAVVEELLHPAGAQADQGELPGREEGHQGQQNGQGQEAHGGWVQTDGGPSLPAPQGASLGWPIGSGSDMTSITAGGHRRP